MTCGIIWGIDLVLTLPIAWIIPLCFRDPGERQISIDRSANFLDLVGGLAGATDQAEAIDWTEEFTQKNF